MTSKTIERIVPLESIVQAEEGEEFQEYVYKATGKKVPKGTNVGFERWVGKDGERYQLILCDDIDFLSYS